MIGNYPVGYWCRGYIFWAFKQPKNSQALGNLVRITSTLKKIQDNNQTQYTYKHIKWAKKKLNVFFYTHKKRERHPSTYSQQGVVLSNCPVHNQRDVESCNLLIPKKRILDDDDKMWCIRKTTLFKKCNEPVFPERVRKSIQCCNHHLIK